MTVEEEEAASRRRTSILRCPLISLMRGLMGPSFSFDSVNNTGRPPLPSPSNSTSWPAPRLVIMSSRINVITWTRVEEGVGRRVPIRRADDSWRQGRGRANGRGQCREMLLTQVATDLPLLSSSSSSTSPSSRAHPRPLIAKISADHLQVFRRLLTFAFSSRRDSTVHGFLTSAFAITRDHSDSPPDANVIRALLSTERPSSTSFRFCQDLRSY